LTGFTASAGLHQDSSDCAFMMSIYLHLPIICSILYIVWYLVAGVGNEGCQEELGSSPWWLGHWDWGILVQLPSCSWNICFDWDQLVVFVLVDIASSSLVGSDFTVCWMMHFYPTYRGSKLPLLCLYERDLIHELGQSIAVLPLCHDWIKSFVCLFWVLCPCRVFWCFYQSAALLINAVVRIYTSEAYDKHANR